MISPHVTQFRFRSQTAFLFLSRALWLAYHVWFLKCLPQSAEGFRAPVATQGGLAMPGATCLITCVLQVATLSLAARLTHIPSVHGCCQVPYHVIMPGNLIVQQVQPVGRFYTPLEHNFVTV